MTNTKTPPRRLRVQPAPSGATNAVVCPICHRPMSMSLLLEQHLDDHHYALFGAEGTGQIRVEITLVVEEAT